jgi:hypothetical protein
MAIGKLEIQITGDARGLKKAAGVAKRQMKGLGGGLKGLERGMGRVADLGTATMIPTMGAIGALGIFVGTAVNAFTEHEQLMGNVATLIDGTAEDVEATTDELVEGVREVGREAPKSLKDLETALYDIVSAGIPADQAIEVLRQSAILATAGLGTTEEAADLLTSALNSYGMSAEDAEIVATIFFETVKAGKTTVSELAASFGSVAPLAANLGVSLEELNAATAIMTTTGLSASESQTALRATMTQLMKPGTDLEDVLNVLGVESGPRFDETLRDLISREGLVDVLSDITTTGKEMGNKMGDLWGSVEAVNAIMILTGEKGKDFENVLADIETQTDKVGVATTNLEQKFEDQTETVRSATQIMRNEIDVWLQDIGGAMVEVGYLMASTIKGIVEEPWKALIPFPFTGLPIPGLADGGIVTKPTLAMIGERGPEAVVPLGQGGTSTITISPTIIIEGGAGSELDMEEKARRMAEILSDELEEYLG